MMRLVQRFATKHDDLIHDVAYDYFGKRLATCSSDRTIRVWDQDDRHEWRCSAEWTAHNGSIWKVHWAAPEYGQILASCSFDRTVCIWEESEGNGSTPAKCMIRLPISSFLCAVYDAVPGEMRKWERRATLPDSHGNVTAVRFAPAHSGLKLATASSDGFVRFYEAIDITNLSQWQITDQFDASENQQSPGVNCVDWNPNPFDQPMVAVGTNDSQGKIYQYNDKLRKWEPVAALIGHDSAIHDIAWAPNMGRSYHLLATASKDKTVRIWKLDLNKGKLEAKQVQLFTDHSAEVWRVEWNITGTILASSGDDNVVRLWKQNLMGEWKALPSIAAAEDGDD